MWTAAPEPSPSRVERGPTHSLTWVTWSGHGFSHVYDSDQSARDALAEREADTSGTRLGILVLLPPVRGEEGVVLAQFQRSSRPRARIGDPPSLVEQMAPRLISALNFLSRRNGGTSSEVWEASGALMLDLACLETHHLVELSHVEGTRYIRITSVGEEFVRSNPDVFAAVE